MKITKDSSGLTIITDTIQGNVFGIQIWLGVGSGFERDTQAGYAHFLEHMVFKGTPKAVKAPDFATAIEGIGGSINAYTSLDQTVYHASVAKDYWQETLSLLGQMTFAPSFQKDEMERERGVILEEIKQGKDNPWRFAYQNFFGAVFSGHNYGRPVIGYNNTVSKVTHPQLKNFWRQFYHPARAIVSVVGPGTDEDLLKKIQRILTPHLKSFRGTRPAKDPALSVAGRSPKFAVGKSSFKDRIACLGFATGPGNSKDQPYWDLLASMIGQGESSPLVSILERELELVQSLSTGCYGGRFGGAMMLIAQLKQGHEKAYFEKLSGLLNKAGDLLSDDHLERARTSILADDIYSRETSEGLASKLAGAYLLFGDLEHERQYRERVESATIEDIAQTAKRVFRGRWGGYLMLPEKQPSAPFKSAMKIAVAKDSPKAKAKKPSGLWNELEIAPGVTLFHAPIRHVPLFSVRATLAAGSTFENARQAGITRFLSDMMTKGSGNLSTEQFSLESEKLGGSSYVSSGRNTWSYCLDGLTKNIGALTDLFEIMIEEPRLPESEIGLLREQTLHEIKLKEDDLPTLCIRGALQKMFGEHSLALPMIGTPESVGEFTRDRLEAFRNNLSSRPLSIAVAGHYSSKDLDRVIRLFAKPQTLSVPSIGKPQLASAPGHWEEQREKEQSHLVVAYPTPPLHWPQRHVLHVITGMLSGMGGRLFQNLREKMSLAYSVHPVAFETPLGGFWGVHLSTSPSRTDEALEAVNRELRHLITKPPTADEVQRTIRHMVGGIRIDEQKISSQAAAVALNHCLGFTLEDHLGEAELLKKVTPKDVLKVLRELLETHPSVTAVLRGRG